MVDNSDLGGHISIRSYMAEMHNDGLYFFEEANRAEDVFVKSRFLRAGIIFFCTSVEAAMSTIVHRQLLKMNNLSKPYKKLKRSLSSPNKLPPKFFQSIEGKISVIESLFNSSFSEDVKSNYIDLTHLRNKIVHYSTSYYSVLYESSEVEWGANRSPEIADMFLSELFGFADLSLGFQKNRTPRY
jgi:hypothetical protein